MSEMDFQSIRVGCQNSVMPHSLPMKPSPRTACSPCVVTQSHGTHPLAAWLNRRIYSPSRIASGGNENVEQNASDLA